MRFATFNASLNRFNAGDLAAELAIPGSAQPDDDRRDHPAHPSGSAADQRVRLRRRRRGARVVPGQLPVGRPWRRRTDRLPVPLRRAVQHRGSTPGSTWTTMELSVDRPNDAFGFGFFPGQFGMAVYSMYPIELRQRPHLPELPVEGHAGRAAAGSIRAPASRWYDDEELDVFRLSSKSHWDVPILIGKRRCTSWPAIRRRRSSTVRRTATAPATTTRSASGRTTSSLGVSGIHLRRRWQLRRSHARFDVRDRRRPELRSPRR